MKSNIKYFVPPAVAAALALALGPGCKPSGSNALIQYDASPVKRGPIVEYVTASGSLSNLVSVDVGCQVSGKIVSMSVDYNSPVKKNQVVAEIDQTTYKASLRQAESELASAKADLLLKEQNYERKKILVPKKAAPQSDLDTATAELGQAKATVEMRDAALETARANLGYCTITAPVDGVVLARKVDIGQTVNAAMNTPILFTIAEDMTKMNISATVSEADIGQVRDGQSVDFTVDAFPDETFHGVVKQVRRSPTTTQNVVTYETIISVENPELKLFPGMTAELSIFVAQRTNAIVIPNTALRYAPPEHAAYEQEPPKKLQRNERLIYTLGQDKSKLRPVVVKVGISDGSQTEIIDGLKEGEMVVTSTLSGVKKTSSGGPPPHP